MPFPTYEETLAREENYSHPEKIYKDIIFEDEDIPLPPDVVEARKKLINVGQSPFDSTGKPIELCWLCGWNAYDQLLSSYGSRVRIVYTKMNVGLWELGSRWLLRDQPNDDSLGNDFLTQDWLMRNHAELKLPLTEMQRLSEPEDKVHLLLMKRAKGKPLMDLWRYLTAEEKASYTRQMTDIVKSWRTLTAPAAQRVDGSPTHDTIIASLRGVRAPTCGILGRNNEEWFQNLEEMLRAGISHRYKTQNVEKIDEIYRKLKANFPKSEPYVLTHGDLNLSNIIVNDGKIEAILDWEAAAFMPWWAERYLLRMRGTPHTDELFDEVFVEVDGGMDLSTFQEEVIVKVSLVEKTWEEYDVFVVDHKGFDTRYLRPGFCECKPFAGHFAWRNMGNKMEHIPSKNDERIRQTFEQLKSLMRKK